MLTGSVASQAFTGRSYVSELTSLFHLSADYRLCSRGVWALIQAQISQIDFDYASYAEVRLGEYFAWRRELDGTRAKAGEEMPLRERRWAQEI